ncbi:hypothetical protein EMIT0196MI5_200077 [Pseudomonas sp. IT-196MI5]
MYWRDGVRVLIAFDGLMRDNILKKLINLFEGIVAVSKKYSSDKATGVADVRLCKNPKKFPALPIAPENQHALSSDPFENRTWRFLARRSPAGSMLILFRVVFGTLGTALGKVMIARPAWCVSDGLLNGQQLVRVGTHSDKVQATSRVVRLTFNRSPHQLRYTHTLSPEMTGGVNPWRRGPL